MVIIPIASLPIEFIRKTCTQAVLNTGEAFEIALPTSLRASGGYAVFLYAWEVEIESAIDLVADLDSARVILSKTQPQTELHLNDSQVIGIIGFVAQITGVATSLLIRPSVMKETFIRPIILAGEKIYCWVESDGLAAPLTVNIRLHYQLKWVNAQVFNRSLLTNV